LLAFAEEDRGEPANRLGRGTESLAGKRGTESPAIGEQLMEEVCGRENCKQALATIKANKGSAGVDGMTVQRLPEHLKQHWPVIREQLLLGTYKPQPAKRVEIPKPDRGIRKLGIPTVLDRFIQQAVMQVLQRRWDRTFSEHSYGFRPGRSAHQAVEQAQKYIAEGYRWAVDLALGKFFGSVDHEKLLTLVAQRIADGRKLWQRAAVSNGARDSARRGVICPPCVDFQT
jgi:RNA-directed DNA polymerase